MRIRSLTEFVIILLIILIFFPSSIYAMDKSVPLIGGEYLYNTGITGIGQTVCIIDTGVDYTHSSLSSSYLGGYDFGDGDSDPMDTEGHGTQVAGIILIPPRVRHGLKDLTVNWRKE